MKHFACAIVAVVTLLLASAAGADWWVATDDHPRQIAPGVWFFSVNVPVRPVGQLSFVNAQYDFFDYRTGLGTATDGMSVDYTYDGPGIDWSQDGALLAVAPTLFDTGDGFIQGWSAWNVVNGKFSGTVYATAPLVRVWFTVEAEHLVRGVEADHLVRGKGRP